MTGETISLDRYFAAVWRAKWLIIIAVAGAAALTAFLGFRQPTLYTATALLEVGRVWKEPLEDTYATTEIVKSAGFQHRLAEKTGIKYGQLRRSIQADTVTAGPRRSSGRNSGEHSRGSAEKDSDTFLCWKPSRKSMHR